MDMVTMSIIDSAMVAICREMGLNVQKTAYYRAANGQSWQTVCQAFGKVSPSKYSNVPMRPGDRMRVSSPGGGGYGDPRRRDPALVAEDVREGYVSREAAARLYGFEES
jgi:N-methylhydantoinase B/oxoprolinase/acetone carboxylase alpha subunit